jgi:hypothetical protein
VLYFLIYFATEIFLLVQFIDSFGGWGFVAELFLSAFSLCFWQDFKLLLLKYKSFLPSA